MIKKFIDWFFRPLLLRINELQEQLHLEHDKNENEFIRLEGLQKVITNQLFSQEEKIMNQLLTNGERVTNQFNDFEERTTRCLNSYKKKIEYLESNLNLIKKNDLILEEKFFVLNGELEKNLSSLSREIMRTKWKLIDYLEDKNYDENEVVECILCGHKDAIKGMEKIVSNCIFSGGRLERYKCPKCGCIFGPTKFKQQSDQELADDYNVHYLGYKENDSTEGEVESFFLLDPSHDGRYLNYGCGKWADTIVKLRNAGYDVYGYDPYAADVENEYVISDINVIKKMRFDGIFSHDLLEHLMNPIQEMLFIKSLLKSPICKMAHSTACYEYKFEYTRFHTCFYTGNAVDTLCKRTNLYIDKYVDDGKQHNFICYVYGVLDQSLSFIKEMGKTNNNEKMEVSNGERFYGPYLTCAKGQYLLTISLKSSDKQNINLRITADKGGVVLQTSELENGKNIIELELVKEYKDLEFVIISGSSQSIELLDIGFIS